MKLLFNSICIINLGNLIQEYSSRLGVVYNISLIYAKIGAYDDWFQKMWSVRSYLRFLYHQNLNPKRNFYRLHMQTTIPWKLQVILQVYKRYEILYVCKIWNKVKSQFMIICMLCSERDHSRRAIQDSELIQGMKNLKPSRKIQGPTGKFKMTDTHTIRQLNENVHNILEVIQYNDDRPKTVSVGRKDFYPNKEVSLNCFPLHELEVLQTACFTCRKKRSL